MPRNVQYKFNRKTLQYEIKKRSKLSRILGVVFFLVSSILLASLFIWVNVSVLGNDLPKTQRLKKERDRLRAEVEGVDRALDRYSEDLSMLKVRDNDIYRSIFGMNEIPDDVRNSGFGEYELESEGYLANNKHLSDVMRRLDMLSRRAYSQSKSFDDVSSLSKRAGEMATSIPAIPPMNPDPEAYRISSSFGRRKDPFTGKIRRHTGVDFAMKKGYPIYATGDGVVESVKFEFYGYGNQIVIDHGFGYKTRYAHMHSIGLAEGMKVKRGECVGLSGNSGRSSGPHLHYEVIYKGVHQNPANFYDLSISQEEYAEMVQGIADSSERVTLHPSHRK